MDRPWPRAGCRDLGREAQAGDGTPRNRKSGLLQSPVELAVCQLLGSIFRRPLPAQRLEAARLVDEEHLAAQLVLDQVAGENLGFGFPGLEQHMGVMEALVPGRFPEFLQGAQARVAAGLDDVVLFTGPARHRERIVDAALRQDRGLDLLELGIGMLAGILLVAPDLGHIQQELGRNDRVAGLVQGP